MQLAQLLIGHLCPWTRHIWIMSGHILSISLIPFLLFPCSNNYGLHISLNLSWFMTQAWQNFIAVPIPLRIWYVWWTCFILIVCQWEILMVRLKDIRIPEDRGCDEIRYDCAQSSIFMNFIQKIVSMMLLQNSEKSRKFSENKICLKIHISKY